MQIESERERGRVEEKGKEWKVEGKKERDREDISSASFPVLTSKWCIFIWWGKSKEKRQLIKQTKKNTKCILTKACPFLKAVYFD